MTVPPRWTGPAAAGAAAPVRCPICLEPFTLPGREIYVRSGGKYEPLPLAVLRDPVQGPESLRNAYVKCPNPVRDRTVRIADHYLPYALAVHKPPIVLALVGATTSGKTHLLAAMIAEIEKGALHRHRLTATALDPVRHAAFLRGTVQPLMDGKELPPTPEDVVEFIDALLVVSPSGTWPVVFFDIAGGDFQPDGPASRFVVGATGLIFVVDPSRAFNRTGPDEEPSSGSVLNDHAVQAVLSRLSRGQQYLDVPAAIVINKADRLRFVPPADAWMRRPPSQSIDPQRIRAESQDAFAMLYQQDGGEAWLAPFHQIRRCTLHFASATGAEPKASSFPHGVHPRRVLEPLFALFAMTGVITGKGTAEVGL